MTVLNSNSKSSRLPKALLIYLILLLAVSCALPPATTESGQNTPTQSPSLELSQNLGSGTLAPAPGDPDWQVYRNPRLGFEIAFAKTMIVHSQEPYAQGVMFSGPVGAVENLGAWFGIYQPVRDSWIRAPNIFEQWYERDRKALSESRVYTILSEEKVVVGGFSGLKVIYQHNLSGRQKFLIKSFVPVPVNREDPSPRVYAVHVMQFGGPWDESQKPKYLAIYDRMLFSLKFFNPTR